MNTYWNIVLKIFTYTHMCGYFLILLKTHQVKWETELISFKTELEQERIWFKYKPPA